MSTYFNTQTGKEIGYDLQFHTEDREKYEFMQEAARRCIDNEIVSTADVAPVIHAKWEQSYQGHDDRFTYTCSNCSYQEHDNFTKHYRFCPHCGAKMDGEVRNE